MSDPPVELSAALPLALDEFGPVALMVLDADLRIVWASTTTARSMQRTVEEMIGRDLREVQRPGMVTEGVVSVLRAGLERRVDVSLEWGDGRERDVVVFPVVVGERRCIGFAAVLFTSSVHRTIDEYVLRESLLADAAQLGVWRLDLRDGSLVGNSWYAKVNDVGTPDAPGVLGDVADRVHPDDVDRWRATIDRAITTGEPYTMKYRLLGPNGETKVLQSRARLAPGRSHQLFGVVMDVTAAETAAGREAGHHLRQSLLTDAAQLGLWEWDRATDRVVWNEWHERLFGYEPGTPERTFDDWTARVHPDDVAATSAQLAAAVEHGRLFESSYRVVLPSGEIRHLEGRGQLDPNDPMHMVGVVFDVTDRQRAADREAELQRQALLASDAERDRIAADIHDGPLQGLSAAWLRLTTLAMQLDGRADDGAELAALAREVAAALARTNQDLRDVLGRLRSLPVDASLDTFVEQVGDIGDELAEQRGFAFSIGFAAGGRETLPGDVMATAYRILVEAILNAGQHAEPTRIDVRVAVEGDRLVATVTDDGIGFDTAAPRPSGHFGLSIMRQRARGVEGTVSVSSAPGAGTTVTMVLPLAPVSPR